MPFTAPASSETLLITMASLIFTARRYVGYKRGTSRRASVCLFVYYSRVLYQNG